MRLTNSRSTKFLHTLFHSDDFGFTPNITRRIGEAWSAGYLDGFSILANGYACDVAQAILADQATLRARISVHLNLCEGPALIRTGDRGLITDSEGNLNCSVGGLWSQWMISSADIRKELLIQIETEWRKQIAAVVDLCRPRAVTAVDGHMHVHMLPFLFPVAADLAVEFGVPEIRISRERFHLSPDWRDSMNVGFSANIAKHIACRHWAKSARRIARAKGLRSPDALVGLLYTGRMTARAARAGMEASRRAGAETVEVLFHVGRASADEKQYWLKNARAGAFPLSDKRDAEFEALADLHSGANRGLG